MKSLIYNKDEKSRQIIKKLFSELNFNVLTVSEEEALIDEMNVENLDIVFIDVKSYSNFSKKINKIIENKKSAYILLSIDEKDIFSKSEALLNGVDDYILNNFTLEELSAKIKAIVRILTRILDENKTSEVLTVHDLTLNPISREVIRNGKEIELTNKEFLLLEYFLRNKNRVLTRTMISEKIWDIDFITESNIVDVYINFLRSKIDKNYDQKIIKTVRGVGYIVKSDH